MQPNSLSSKRSFKALCLQEVKLTLPSRIDYRRFYPPENAGFDWRKIDAYLSAVSRWLARSYCPLPALSVLSQVSHLWYERPCRPLQMRMWASPRPYIFLGRAAHQRSSNWKENSPGKLISRPFDGVRPPVWTCMRALSHGPDGSVTLVKNITRRCRTNWCFSTTLQYCRQLKL